MLAAIALAPAALAYKTYQHLAASNNNSSSKGAGQDDDDDDVDEADQEVEALLRQADSNDDGQT